MKGQEAQTSQDIGELQWRIPPHVVLQAAQAPGSQAYAWQGAVLHSCAVGSRLAVLH
jgi:hypothetical protein